MSSKHSLTRSSFAAMAGALLSRVSGVIRTIIVNAIFGAATSLDAFNAAFRFPNSLRDLFADGALSSAFMTVLVPAKETDIEEERKLISIIIGFFSCVTFLIALLAAVYAEPFMRLLSNAEFIQRGGLHEAVMLFRWLAFYLPITMLNAVAMAILGVHGYTFRAMNGSIFLSVGMIVGVLIFAHYTHPAILGLALGAMLGVILQLLYQLQPLFKLNLMVMPNFNPLMWLRYQPLHEVLKLMAPRILGQGAMTLALMINTFFALQIGVGVLTYITTAILIIQVPIGLFGVATGFAALPVLTDAIYKKEINKFSQLLTESLRTAQWLAAFTALGFALWIVPFYIVLFQHGKITFTDTIGNCTAVCAYSMGIIFAAGGKVLVNALYAVNATKQIVYNSLAYLIVNALLSGYLAPRLGILGLGLSFGVATGVDFWLNYIFLARAFRRQQFGLDPYQAIDRYFTVKTLAFTALSFAIGLIGVELIKHVWIYHENLTIKKALIVLIVGGLVTKIIFAAIIYFFGPEHLRRVVRKIVKV